MYYNVMQDSALAAERPPINIANGGVSSYVPLHYPIFDLSTVRVKPWHALTVFGALCRQITTDLDFRMVDTRYRGYEDVDCA
jgi:hypothetical protein